VNQAYFLFGAMNINPSANPAGVLERRTPCAGGAPLPLSSPVAVSCTRMCPVDPTKLKSIKPVLIDHDVACVKCGYNLVGLMSDGICPECGRKIKIRSRDLPRYGDSLVLAPMTWLGVLATGSLLLFISSLGVFASLGVAAWLAGKGVIAGPLIAGVFGIMWYIGVWLVTRPRPVTPVTTVDPNKEWFSMRWSARITQTFWFITAVLLAAYAKTSEPALGWAAIPSFVVAALGLIPLCALVSNIAYWGSDTTLSSHFRACAWSVGFAAVLIALHIMNIYTRSNVMGGFWASMIAGFLIFFAVLPFFYIVFSSFQLQSMSRWALLNHATADAKDERLRKRAEAAAGHRLPETPPLVENVDLAAFNLTDSAVDDAADQEAMRRQGHIVQPKAHDDRSIPVDETPIRRNRPSR
jgi:hypothetical protein